MAALGLAVAENSPFVAVFLQRRAGVVPIRSAGPGRGGCAGFRAEYVVEHKAQRHTGRFALVSRLGCSAYSDAPLYFNGGPFASRFKGACEDGNRLTKAQKASFRGGAESIRPNQSKSALIVVVRGESWQIRLFRRWRGVPSAPASVKALRFAPPAAAALSDLDRCLRCG
jgi:hypothetical protein